MKRVIALLLVIFTIYSFSFSVQSAELTKEETTTASESTAAEATAPEANDSASASDLDFAGDLRLFANATYLVNLDSGRVIYQNNAGTRVSPASTTKIMTAALALTLCDDPKNTIVTLPEDLWAEFQGINITHADLKGGEELTMEQLVYCLLLQSANEAASGVAAYFGGQDFIDLMNEKAKSLGCRDTHFVNPHGLFNEDHYTTAEDLYKITKWALSIPGFLDIASQDRYTIPPTNKSDEKVLATTILMQDPNSGYYTSYIRGVKTGTIDESGRCLVSTAEKNGTSYCLVLMGCPFEFTDVFWAEGRSVFNETRIIYDWMFENAKVLNVINPDTVVTEIGLHYASKRDSLVLYPEGQLSAVINKNSGLEPVIRYDIDAPESIEAPIAFGQEIGTAKVYSDNIYLGEVKLISREEVEYSWFVMVMEKMTAILTSRVAYIIYAVIVGLVLFYLYYILVLVNRSQKKGKKTRRTKRKRTHK